MRKYIISIVTVLYALISAPSCSKVDLNLIDGQTEHIIIKISPATKTVLGEYKGTDWVLGDQVSLSVDGEVIGTLELVAYHMFEGDIKSGYSDKAEVVINYPAGVTKVPTVQKAVNGSFANGAALLEGKTTLDKLRAGNKIIVLENKTAVLKFSVVAEGDVMFIAQTNDFTITGCKPGETYYACVPPQVDGYLTYKLQGHWGAKQRYAATLEEGVIYSLGLLDFYKYDRELGFSEETYTITLGDTFTPPVLNGNTEGGITYYSENDDVAIVDWEGNVEILAAGETIITASAEETNTLNAGKAQYTLIVKEPEKAVLRINNLNGWVDMNITIMQGSEILVNDQPMLNEGNNIFAYELDSEYVGAEVSYFIKHSWYQTSTKTTTLAAVSASMPITLNTTYLQPGTWDWKSATFGAWMWGSGATDVMVTGVKVSDNFFEFEIPSTKYKYVIFLRCDKNYQVASWDTVWNQTEDLTLKHLCFCVDSWDKANLTNKRWY